jgi:hypothetical protein
MTIYARVEFNEIQIAESQKIQITNDETPDLNFSFSLSLNAADQASLDDVANKPIISDNNNNRQ